MSTKIYNAFKINTDNIFEVQEILSSHHLEVKELTQDKTIEFLIRSAVLNYDKDVIHNKEISRNYLSKVSSDLMDRQRKVRTVKERDPLIDFEAEILVIPHEGKFYGVYYSEQNDFYEKLLNHNGISEFSYWNNTDRPDNVSAKKWKERETIWNRIFENNLLPCEVGFSKKFNSYIPMPNIEVIVKKWNQYCPTYEDRLKHWTSEVYTEREMSKQKMEVNTNNFSEIIGLYLDIKNDESEEAQKKREQIKNELEKMLIKDLSPENIGISIDGLKKPKMR